MKHIIIGTAGHIDHGKTALVQALTGIDTDRLKEEKLRGITIDLGFAYLIFDDLQIGFIDVPGHERFVHNMLAGIGGIDAVLLVVAADESVMPQTREHFDICRLLAIPRGAVVVNKVDLVDPELLELVLAEVHDLVRGSFLEDAPIFQVSSKTGTGLQDLKEWLHHAGQEGKRTNEHHALRMPVDRVFTVKGFGTVVTGTLLAGTLRKDQEVEFLPGTCVSRVRNLQSYGQQVSEAFAGQRVAVNVQGVDVGRLGRGMVLAERGTFEATSVLDVRIEALENSPTPIKDMARVHLHIGSHELIAKVALFGISLLQPGHSGFAQLRLEEPTVSVHGDRFILRRFSPLVTIGGGVVLHNQPQKLKRRRAPRLATDPQFERADEISKIRLDLEWSGLSGRSYTALCRIFGWNPAAVDSYLRQLETKGDVALVGRPPHRAVSRRHIEAAQDRLLTTVRQYHAQFPLNPGVAKEELRQRLFPDQSPELFNFLIQELSQQEKIDLRGDAVALFGRTVTLSEESVRLKEDLESLFRDGGLTPPSVDEALGHFQGKQATAKSVLHILLREERLLKITEDLIVHSHAVQALRQTLQNNFPAGVPFGVSHFKDLFGLTRKYAIPILEYLDRQRITRRQGDQRILL